MKLQVELDAFECETVFSYFHSAVCEAQEQSFFNPNEAEKQWWKGHHAYLQGILDKLVAGVSK